VFESLLCLENKTKHEMRVVSKSGFLKKGIVDDYNNKSESYIFISK